MHNHDVDELLPHYREDYTPDVAAGLARLRQRTGQDAPVRRLRPTRWLAATAAAAALFLLAAGWVLFGGPGEGRVILSAASEPLAAELPDGSSVLLQRGSTLSYSAATYGTSERRVELRGQAYVEVTPDAAAPFRVAGPAGAELRVTGTAFNLRVSDSELEVEVNHGSVVLERGGQTLPVGERQCGLSKAGAADLSLMAAPNLNRHAWRTGELTFRQTPLPEVLDCIRKVYGVSVAGAGECSFPVSGTIQGRDAATVLAAVARHGGAGGRVHPVGAAGDAFELTGLCPE